MILGLQAIALVFILIMLYFTYLHMKRGELSGIEAILLFSVWLGAALITLFPSNFKNFSETIAVSRPFDLAVIGGFLFVMPLVYISYIRTKKNERKLEDLIRKTALKDLYSEKKSK